MKFKDPITGEYKELNLKTGDTLPIGTIVSVDTDEIPPGYEEVVGEEARVVISSTEPTTGEEVWIQKGKNLFDKNNVFIGYLNGDGSLYTGENIYRTSAFISISPNTTYYKTQTGSVRTKFYDINKNPLTDSYEDIKNGSGAMSFTTPTNAHYLRVSLTDEYLGTLQIEQGDTSTAYEPFTRKIYTKNNNGAYEEFYDETKRGSNEKGNWIKYSDGTLICYGTITGVTVPQTGYSTQNIAYPIQFEDYPHVFVTPKGNYNISGQVSYAEKDHFVYNARSVDGAERTGRQYFWFAIGNWK